ncbi:GNAT family N-acetyltransferase [Parasulfuritortus cantonensis]|uniref:GNAT family N-acetyltransferase n=1 Tax=Parasulfuritortus cantonensis TaxID=2528202 RepID=A0A4R1BDM5_9PROT|nr:GNAT family N-acetyltransferase [Parasulfuritortus cantonensis]TCJ15163.1 GNAT family N-acetyltransferase [Parasulfuritortus cantonensis]
MFTDAEPIPNDVTIRPAHWPEDAAAIAAVRRAVFIDEQGVPEALEWEAIDPECAWFVAQAGATTVAVARLTPAGRIGRMAVLAPWRGRGIGRALLECLIGHGRRLGLAGLELHGQCHALGFYARQGFRADGPEFAEAGIPHRRMYMNLKEN